MGYCLGHFSMTHSQITISMPCDASEAGSWMMGGTDALLSCGHSVIRDSYSDSFQLNMTSLHEFPEHERM